MSSGYRRIYYDGLTGNKIAEVALDGGFIPQTVERDIESFSVLSERNRETFDVLELPFGAYANDFREGTLIGVDLEKRIPIFAYPDPNEPSEPIVPLVPLSVEVDNLKQQNTLLKAQAQANADRADFQEELIVEMAMLVYA